MMKGPSILKQDWGTNPPGDKERTQHSDRQFDYIIDRLQYWELTHSATLVSILELMGLELFIMTVVNLPYQGLLRE